MEHVDDATLLRIFIGEDDRHRGRPLYEAIVMALREHGLAGATVLRGTMGFGRSSVLHSAKVLRLSQDLPIIIECIDQRPNIDRVLPVIDGMIGDGLVTLEKAEIVIHRGRDDDR